MIRQYKELTFKAFSDVYRDIEKEPIMARWLNMLFSVAHLANCKPSVKMGQSVTLSYDPAIKEFKVVKFL